MIELQTLIDIGIGVVTFATSAATMAGSVWLFFRKRIRRWWQPYRTGIEGMGRLPELEASVTRMGDDIELLTAKMQARADMLEQGTFECAADGRNVGVSLPYARMLGVGTDDLEGWGYINYIHPDDRAGVRAEWDACRREHRVYERQHRMITAAGDTIVVHVFASPVPNAPPAKAWVGVVRRLGGDEA